MSGAPAAADGARGLRIVVDTNVLVSGVLSATGPPRQLLNAATSHAFELSTSEVMLPESALAGSADLIASGDKRHVLPLGSYEGIPIVTAREAIERVGLGSPPGGA